MSDNRGAWADYWAAGPSGAGGCLPGAHADIENAQRTLWQEFARKLRRGAQVLDLGTGDGAVLRKMQAVRPDLKLVGIDSSPRLPAAPKGISLRAGVGFEALPFAERRFDAVTSQFGYEYGDTDSAAPEVARVLKDGGKILFAVHRSDAPILGHNLSRRDALRWALESGWLDKARALAAARRTMPLPTPATFRSAAKDAQARFPKQSVAGEFLLAVLQTLEMGKNRPPAETLDVLNTLESKARNEIARLDALERAACDSKQVAKISSELAEAGIAVDAPDVLVEGSAASPFAWLLTGVRRSA